MGALSQSVLDGIPARVAAGAALLDEERPGWDSRVDLGRLEVRSDDRCPLSQAYAGEAWYRFESPYAFAAHAVEIDTLEQAALYGFCAFTSRSVAEESAALNEAWLALIVGRRLRRAAEHYRITVGDDGVTFDPIDGGDAVPAYALAGVSS